MSSAVLLEGNIEKSSGNENLKWSGVWRFVKDKKGFLQFNYKKVGHEIPRDLYEYVSFLDPISLSAQSSKPSRLSKHRRRGRGRPPAVVFPPSRLKAQNPTGTALVAPAESLADSGNITVDISINDDHDAVDQSDPINDNQLHEIDDMVMEDQTTGEDREDMEQEEDRDEGGMDQSVDCIKGDMSYSIDEAITANKTPVGGTSSSAEMDVKDGIKRIPCFHPLAGVWQGNFSIKTLKGEELIEEVLFFHSMLGADTIPHLKDLPPDPSFPYPLLKQQSTDSQNSSSKILQSPSADCLTLDKKSDSDQISSAQEQTGNGLSFVNSEQSGNLDAASTSEEVNEKEIIESQDLDVDPESINDNAAASLAYGYSTAALDDMCERVIIGFGQNSIGRFSVAALYDEATGELRCEKKYMTVKFSIKRGRRSLAEYAMSHHQSGGNLAALIVPPPQAIMERPPSTRKASLNSSIYGTPDGGSNGMVSGTASGRQKQNKIFFYLDEEASGSNGNLEMSASKRKRLSSSGNITPAAGSGLTASGSKSKSSLKSSREDFQTYMANNPNALIGSRNPDNDDVTSSGFKEAFQDCDTGEIYEGGWLDGQRYGQGLCLYADGLLYEGNWYKGKEHGKGNLMTGDRKVIYSGDWLEGFMHGNGVYYFGNGDQYVGDWKEGNRHGRGEYLMVNRCQYIGDWKENKRHGKGKFLWPDGSFYEGEWENDRRHGRGLLELSNGFKYEGYWLHNVMEGKGTTTFPSGQSYQGTYKAGLRDGRGSVQFAEGPVYEGRFKEDRFDGQGTLKIERNVAAGDDSEIFIPIQIQSDLSRIHWKAGFGNSAH